MSQGLGNKESTLLEGSKLISGLHDAGFRLRGEHFQQCNPDITRRIHMDKNSFNAEMVDIMALNMSLIVLVKPSLIVRIMIGN